MRCETPVSNEKINKLKSANMHCNNYYIDDDKDLCRLFKNRFVEENVSGMQSTDLFEMTPTDYDNVFDLYQQLQTTLNFIY